MPVNNDWNFKRYFNGMAMFNFNDFNFYRISIEFQSLSMIERKSVVLVLGALSIDSLWSSCLVSMCGLSLSPFLPSNNVMIKYFK